MMKLEKRLRHYTGITTTIPATILAALIPEDTSPPIAGVMGLHFDCDANLVTLYKGVLRKGSTLGQDVNHVNMLSKVDIFTAMTHLDYVEADLLEVLTTLTQLYRKGKMLRLALLRDNPDLLIEIGFNTPLWRFLDSPEAILIQLYHHEPKRLAQAARHIDIAKTAADRMSAHRLSSKTSE